MFKRILVAVDGSSTSNKALVAALNLARQGGGCVRLFHSIDDLPYVTGMDLGANPIDILGILRASGQVVLDDALAIGKAAGVPVDTVLKEDFGVRIGETVAAEATAWKADLIVLGTHGRRGVRRLLLGSGAEQIIRDAPVAVLVIRDTEANQP